MYISYHNYKGGTNNLIVVSEGNVRGSSLIDLEHAIRNFKRNWRKYNSYAYNDKVREI